MNAEMERGGEEEEEGKEWGKAMSEDCLVLNVFAPSNSQLNFNSNTATTSPARLKPVFIYIHGGGFVGGSAGTAWNFTRLSGDVIVVAIQYRLGVLGFFSPDGAAAAPANFGMQDQQHALQWVQDNAAAFGGDRDQVTIYGCSAGGASVAGHLVLKPSFGMYKLCAFCISMCRNQKRLLGWNLLQNCSQMMKHFMRTQ